jgi:hypothetical protein
MTIFVDTNIPFDPGNPDAINPALEYLSYVAWPRDEDEANRRRLLGAMAGAIYKQVGRQIPPNLPRVKRERVASTVRRAIWRIQRKRLPAALMAFSRWAEQDLYDIAFADLASNERKRLVGALAKAAVKLRSGESSTVWKESRPALAMAMALPISWAQMAFPVGYRDEYGEVSALFLEAGWVNDAVFRADFLSRCLEHTIHPPTLRVPRFQELRTDARWVPILKHQLFNLLNP